MTTVSSTSSTTTAATTGYSALSAADSGTGIDYSALIEAKVSARLSRADTIDLKITANEAKAAAYEALQTALQDMATAIDGLRNRSSSTGASSNLFSEMTAYLSNDDALAVTADEDAAEGTYSVIIKQLATKHKIGADEVSSSTDALSYSGSFTLSSDSGTAVSIDISSDDSLTDIQDAINNESDTTGVTASIIKVSDGTYQLVLSTNETGEEISLTDGDDGVLQSLGLLDSSGNIANELVASQDAIISVDGVEITRSSNTIDDAIDGLSLDLYEADEDETISVEISTDLSGIKDALTSFVDAYNTYREFVITQQTQNDDGEAEDDAVLYSDSLLKNINKQVYAALNGTVEYDGDTYSLSSLLGITFTDDNSLEYDEDTLNTALTDNLEAVKALLGLTMTSSSSQMQMLRYNSDSTAMSFTLDVEVNEDGTLSSASINGDSSLFTVSGNRIIGADGSAYEGLVLVYTGSSGSVDIDITDGVIDRLYSTIDDAADDTDSDIESALSDIEDEDYTLETRSNNIKEQAETYRTNLTAYYAKLEAKAETAALLLQQLTYSDSSDDS